MTQELIDLVPDEEKRRYDLSFYNPIDYHREMVAVGEYNSTWDSGLLTKRRINPVLWGQAHFGGLPWRVWAVGTMEYASTTTPVQTCASQKLYIPYGI